MTDQDNLILLDTPDWLAINKPAGWLSIPGRGLDAPVALERMTERFGRLFVVHRLDLETSGVLLFARNEDAHRMANEWFATHRVRKVYDALCQGSIGLPMFRVESPIEGAPSGTQFEVKRRFGPPAKPMAMWVRAMPRTGRRHQIRIHLKEKGCPILGDRKYGGAGELPGLGLVARVALHAASLEAPIELRAGQKTVQAPWPLDFKNWMNGLENIPG